jgi:hypothetical protein
VSVLSLKGLPRQTVLVGSPLGVLQKHKVGHDVMDSLIATFETAVARNGHVRAAR